MKLSSRMLDLQRAMDLYGDTTVRNFRAVEALGDRLILRLQEFLGDGAAVLGVPPEGEFRVNGGDYHGAKFSFYHQDFLTLEPIKMGVAIGIPHSKDDGRYWMRVVVEFNVVNDAIAFRVGDGMSATRQISLSPDGGDLDYLCDEVFRFAKSRLEDPAKAAASARSGSIGFLNDYRGTNAT